jgi:hypothetical protein
MSQREGCAHSSCAQVGRRGKLVVLNECSLAPGGAVRRQSALRAVLPVVAWVEIGEAVADRLEEDAKAAYARKLPYRRGILSARRTRQVKLSLTI